MQNKATLQWTMRASPQDKKVITDLAKHYHCKQARLVKVVMYQLHAMKIAGRNNPKLSPV